MLDLLKKEYLTKEELSKLDNYLGMNVESMVTYLSNEDIIRIIDLIKQEYVISNFYDSLISHLAFEDLYALFINDEDIEYYLKLYDLEKLFSYDSSYLGLGIANYYFNQSDKEKALELYKEVFVVGKDLSSISYYESLERYIDLLKVDSIKVLCSLIDGFPNKEEHGNDLINSYLLVLSKLDKNNEKYLRYINEALPLSLTIVREYQKEDNERYHLSDSDEERNLCELLCLKLECLVYKKDFIGAFDIYLELTSEIAKSGCVRYYHARDKYYKDMLVFMSEDYKELTFLNDISFKTFKIKEEVNDINEMVNKRITLINENNESLEFIILDVYEDEVTIAPILPLIGVGGKMFTTLYIENDKCYLKHDHL